MMERNYPLTLTIAEGHENDNNLVLDSYQVIKDEVAELVQRFKVVNYMDESNEFDHKLVDYSFPDRFIKSDNSTEGGEYYVDRFSTYSEDNLGVKFKLPNGCTNYKLRLLVSRGKYSVKLFNNDYTDGELIITLRFEIDSDTRPISLVFELTDTNPPHLISDLHYYEYSHEDNYKTIVNIGNGIYNGVTQKIFGSFEEYEKKQNNVVNGNTLVDQNYYKYYLGEWCL